jgi:nucleoside-diphosphate-sugar epimerase
MKIVFIGGTGIISSACAQLAIERGHELYLLNRGQTTKRPIAEGARVLHGDIRDRASARAALGKHTFDAVVDWIAFTTDPNRSRLSRRTAVRLHQFGVVYQTPPANVPVTESTPLDNPVWPYARNKIACEERLLRAYREEKFPMTVVRPSHTYDKTLCPIHGGYTMIDRMRKGQKVIVHGDGTSLWTMTHHKDFARGFVGLLGQNRAVGDTFHITSDEVLTWDQIYRLMGRTAGAESPQLVHVPSELIAAYDKDWGDGLLGDKAHSMIFDNTKIKRLVPDYAAVIPFAQGAQEIVAWFDSDPANRVVDEKLNQTIDRILAAYEAAWPH